MKLTQSVLGISCVLALALGASPASAQSRERAPQRHGSYRQAQPARQGVSRDVRVRSVRGPDRVVNRTVVRTSRGPVAFRGGPGYARGYSRDYVRSSYVRSYSPSRSYASRGYGGYGSYAVPRHYEQRRRGGVYRSGGRYYRPYYRTYYRPYYRSYYPSRFYFGSSWGYPYAFAGYPYLYSGFYGYGPGWGYPYGPYGYGPYYRNGYAEDQGGIRLQMNPKEAQVTVDGYFVGVIDDFDGMSQRLALEEGPHKIEITAPGFEPFTLEVNILREQTIKYKGMLRPLP
jgi:hypothetical protein